MGCFEKATQQVVASVKAANDEYAPINGLVLAVNARLKSWSMSHQILKAGL
jgi:glycine cleavage system H lipoate-binding protein